MQKWNLVIDVARCGNCNNCVLATSDEHVGNDFGSHGAPHAARGERVVRIRRKVRGATPMIDVAYLPSLCQHCDRAPCMAAAGPDGAITKRPDGIVLIDPVKAKGRRDLVDACPYGAIVWNEEQQLPQNWSFEAHRLDAGAQSLRIAEVCPTDVFELVRTTDEDMAGRVEREGLRVLRPELGTKPRVWYRNLERIDHCFIGATVSTLRQGVVDCVEGAVVELFLAGSLHAQTRTDAFGDFRFDRLAPESGPYQVRIGVGARVHSTAASLRGESLYLGEIRL